MYMSNDKATVGRRMIYAGVANTRNFCKNTWSNIKNIDSEIIGAIFVIFLLLASIGGIIFGFVNRMEARAEYEAYSVEKQDDGNYLVKVKNVNAKTIEYYPEDDRSFTFLVYKDGDYEEAICLDSLDAGLKPEYIARKAVIEAERNQLLLQYEHE